MRGRKRFRTFVLGMLLCCSLAVLPAWAEENQTPAITAENYPKVDGSTATLPLSQAVYRLFTGASQAEADEAVVHTKTTNSYLNLLEGRADLLIVADKNEAVEAAIEKSDVKLDIKPIAWDAFVFMTNEENPVRNLTKEEIVGIYSGKITNWSELGGADKDIIPFQRNENAGSQTAMKSLVMKETALMDPKQYMVMTMMDLLHAVASYNNEANALGYSYYYYASLMQKTPGLRFMSVDGILPTNESVADGSYPYIAGYYTAVRENEPEGSPARQIFAWLTGKEGQELIADLGYVPLDPETVPSAIHADSETDAPLPIGEDECLAVTLNAGSLLIFDRDGHLMRRMDSAALAQTDYEVTALDPVEVCILKKNEPVVVYALENSLFAQDPSIMFFSSGLYLPGEDRFLVPPQRGGIQKLPGGYWVCNSSPDGFARLYAKDGTLLKEAENAYFGSMDGYIVCYGGNADRQESTVYDEQLNLFMTVPGSPAVIREGLIVYAGTDGYLTAVDQDGNTLWKMENDCYLTGALQSLLVWDGSEWFVTDWQGNRVMDLGMLQELNPEADGFRYIFLEGADEAHGRLFFRFMHRNGEMECCLCDENFRILETYPEEDILIQYGSVLDNTAQGSTPWHLKKLTENRFNLENLFTGESRSFDVPAELLPLQLAGGSVEKYGGMTCLTLSGISGRLITITLGENGSAHFMKNGALTEKKDILCLRERKGNVRFFYDKDGHYLGGGEELVWLSPDGAMQAVKRGAYLYVESRDGGEAELLEDLQPGRELYLRVLIEDEELDTRLDPSY